MIFSGIQYDSSNNFVSHTALGKTSLNVHRYKTMSSGQGICLIMCLFPMFLGFRTHRCRHHGMPCKILTMRMSKILKKCEVLKFWFGRQKWWIDRVPNLIYLAALPWVSWSTIKDCIHPAKYIEPKQSLLKCWLSFLVLSSVHSVFLVFDKFDVFSVFYCFDCMHLPNFARFLQFRFSNLSMASKLLNNQFSKWHYTCILNT